MVFHGQVRNGVVVLDVPTTLPEGARVRIEPEVPASQEPTWAEVFQGVLGKAEGLPTDLARNHDHYLHGANKR